MPLINVIVFLAVVTALGKPAPATAGLECIQLDLSRAQTLCAGQPTTLSVNVENACSTPRRVSLAFAFDREPVREKAPIVVAPLETLVQRVLLPLPPTTRHGVHTVTVSATDAAGNVRSTDLSVPVAACDLPVASVEIARVGRSSGQEK